MFVMRFEQSYMLRLSRFPIFALIAMISASAMQTAASASHMARDIRLMPYPNQGGKNRNCKRNPPKKLANKGRSNNMSKGRRR
jgi:hypothetical protein